MRFAIMTVRHRIQTPVGVRISALRARLDLTQRQLADQAGVPLDSLKDVEQGRTADPRISTIRRIAAALGVSVDELTAEPEGASG